MAKMHINSIDAQLAATATIFMVANRVVDSGRTAPIFRKLKR